MLFDRNGNFMTQPFKTLVCLLKLMLFQCCVLFMSCYLYLRSRLRLCILYIMKKEFQSEFEHLLSNWLIATHSEARSLPLCWYIGFCAMWRRQKVSICFYLLKVIVQQICCIASIKLYIYNKVLWYLWLAGHQDSFQTIWGDFASI